MDVAVIGCGYWGANYVRLMHELPHARLSVAVDADGGRLSFLRSRHPALVTSASIDEALAEHSFDAAIVATPASAHHAAVRTLLDAGKHVMVEKPLTDDPGSAEDLVAAAERSSVVLMVGLTFLYNPGIRKVREIVSDGSFGTRYYVHCTRTNMGPVRTDVSVVWDLASHDLAICDYVLGAEPVWVQANASSVLGRPTADIAFITLGYPDNVLANVHVSWVDPNKVREVVVVGSHRRVVFDDLNAVERVRVFEKGISQAPQEAGSFGEFRLLARDGDIVSPSIPPGEPLRNQVEHFLECVRDGKAPLTNGRVGLANVRALCAVEQSIARSGARVDV